MAGVLNNNSTNTDESKINAPTSTVMTHVESIDNEIKLLISKKAKKRRPSPSLLSKITGIEISAAPNKSFRKKHKKETLETDVSRTTSVLYDTIVDPEPTITWVTSRIAYDIDNEDEEDAYYPPINNQAQVSASTNNFHENLSDIVGEPSISTHLKETSEYIKPKRSRKNRVSEIANQWSSLITEKTSNSDSLQNFKSKSDFYNEFGDRNQVNLKHRQSSQHHKQRNKYTARNMQDKLSNGSNGFRRHNLRILNTAIQTDFVNTEDSETQTLSTQDLNINFFKLGSASGYQNSTKLFKSKVSDAKNSREKILLLYEASMNSLLESFALELHITDIAAISKKFTDTLNFTKSNGIYISQHLTKEDDDSFWNILSVLNIQMGAYIYYKLYLLRKTEISRAKSTIDEFLMKNSTSPNLYSSPNLSIESSEDIKTQDKMSEKMLSCIQFYANNMEHLAKWHSYVDRANSIVQQNQRVSSFFQSLSLLVAPTKCDENIQIFFNYISEAFQKIKNFL